MVEVYDACFGSIPPSKESWAGESRLLKVYWVVSHLECRHGSAMESEMGQYGV